MQKKNIPISYFFLGTLMILSVFSTVFAQGVPAPSQQNLLPFQNTSITHSGMSIEFPPDQQIITQNSALLAVEISVVLTQPIHLSYAWAKKGNPLSQEKDILQVAKAIPGVSLWGTLDFSNLEKNTTYDFAIKNKLTGIQQVRSFTTLGDNSQQNQVIQGNAIGIDPNSNSSFNPGGFTSIEDTISDKGIVPRCGRTQNAQGTVPQEELRMCTYKDFLQLIANVIQYAIIIIGPIIAILVMYAGAMIIWLGKIPDKNSEQMRSLREYRSMLVRVVIGIGIMLSSYVIVSMILRELGVDPMYILIDIFS